MSIDFNVTPHVLRHTYITRLILGRVPLKRVQYLAGHADPKVTIKIYTDLMGHAPEDLADDINAVFAPVQTPPKTPLMPPDVALEAAVFCGGFPPFSRVFRRRKKQEKAPESIEKIKHFRRFFYLWLYNLVRMRSPVRIWVTAPEKSL